jgi:hypothetical protein
MTSQIDPTVIKENQKVAKSAVREQLQTAKVEITALQNITSVPRKMGFNDTDYDTL